MKTAARRKTDYIWVRPGTDIYWFSRAVPKPLWDAEGRKVIQFSLKTRDRREAEALARQHASLLDVKWGRIKSPPSLSSIRHVPTEEEIDEAVVIVAHDLLLEDATEGRLTLRGAGPNMWRANAAWAQGELIEQRQKTATSDYSLVRQDADLIIESLEFDIPRDSARYAALCEKLNRVRLDALKVKAEQAIGDVDAETNNPIVRKVRERESAKAKAGEAILDCFERWADEQLAKGEKRPDTVTQDRKKITQFANFIGLSRSASSITPIEVAEYRDLLRDLPPKWNAKKGLAGLDIREAARRARELDLPKTSYPTVNSHLSVISPLLDWLRKQPAWAGIANPCNGLFHAKVKGKNRRPSFTTAQLNQILRSPIFTGFASDGKEGKPGSVQADDWRKWIPLLCMFTRRSQGPLGDWGKRPQD